MNKYSFIPWFSKSVLKIERKCNEKTFQGVHYTVYNIAIILMNSGYIAIIYL